MRRQYRQHADVDTNTSEQRAVYSADLEKVVMSLHVEMFKNVLFTRRIIAFNDSFVPVGKEQTLKPMAVISHVISQNTLKWHRYDVQ